MFCKNLQKCDLSRLHVMSITNKGHGFSNIMHGIGRAIIDTIYSNRSLIMIGDFRYFVSDNCRIWECHFEPINDCLNKSISAKMWTLPKLHNLEADEYLTEDYSMSIFHYGLVVKSFSKTNQKY